MCINAKIIKAKIGETPPTIYNDQETKETKVIWNKTKKSEAMKNIELAKEEWFRYNHDLRKPMFYNKYSERIIVAQCGKCDDCKRKRMKEWIFRLQEEKKTASESYFLTMQVENKELEKWHNEKIDTSKMTDEEAKIFFKDRDKGYMGHLLNEMQKFLKRMRKAGYTIKYSAIGEYGEKRGRPHIHMILFMYENEKNIIIRKENLKYAETTKKGYKIYKNKEISEIWGLGKVRIGLVSKKSIGYCFFYQQKKRKILKSLESAKLFQATMLRNEKDEVCKPSDYTKSILGEKIEKINKAKKKREFIELKLRKAEFETKSQGIGEAAMRRAIELTTEDAHHLKEYWIWKIYNENKERYDTNIRKILQEKKDRMKKLLEELINKKNELEKAEIQIDILEEIIIPKLENEIIKLTGEITFMPNEILIDNMMMLNIKKIQLEQKVKWKKKLYDKAHIKKAELNLIIENIDMKKIMEKHMKDLAAKITMKINKQKAKVAEKRKLMTM